MSDHIGTQKKNFFFFPFHKKKNYGSSSSLMPSNTSYLFIISIKLLFMYRDAFGNNAHYVSLIKCIFLYFLIKFTYTVQFSM